MKCRLNLLIFLSLVSFTHAWSQDYAVSSIPESLLENACAVIRIDDNILEADAYGSKTEHRYAITILNKSGNYLNSFREHYDDDRKITSVKATIYDKNGKRIQKYKRSDFEDYSAVSNFSLYEDNRVL
ncbi:MAG: DUF3857 domain-containing protein, partial [bacterium]